jgi:hypothetical protein
MMKTYLLSLTDSNNLSPPVPVPAPPPTATPTPAASPTVIDTLLEHLAALSNQLDSAVELSSPLQAQHAAAQSMILVLEEKVSSLQGLVKTLQANMEVQRAPLSITVEDDPILTPVPAPTPKSLTKMLAEGTKSVKASEHK